MATFDEAFFEDFFIREPEAGNIGGAEAENIFERAADLAEMKIDADALEQFDEFLCAFGQDGFRANMVFVHPMISHNVNGLRAAAMTVNVEEAPDFGLGRGEPGCYT